MSWMRSLMVGLTIGAAVALWICSIALDHNPQGEFADPDSGAFTGDLYVLFAVWMAGVGLPLAALVAVAGRFMRRDD